MLSVTGARHDRHVPSECAHLGDNFVDSLGFADGDDDRRRFHEAATLQELRICRVTVIDGAPLPSLFRNGRGVVIDGKIFELVPIEHRADDLSDPAVSDDDGMATASARRGGKLGIERLVVAHHRGQPPREMRKRGREHHGQRCQRHREARHVGIDQAERCRHADPDEGELAAGAEQQTDFKRSRPRQTKQPGKDDRG